MRSVAPAADGYFTFRVSGLSQGYWFFRVTTPATDKATRGVSTVRRVSVEDVEAAGAAYLDAVGGWNKALDHYNASLDAYDAGRVGFDTLKASAHALSQSGSRMTRMLRTYAYWPADVRPLIDQIAAAQLLVADQVQMATQARGIEEFVAIMNDAIAQAEAAGGDMGVRVRDALGLPKRYS